MCKIRKDEVWGLKVDEYGLGRDLNYMSVVL